jgi:metacaspase-1
VPDDEPPDEADGRDEILCPTDLNWDDTMRDDWLRKTFDSVAAGVNLTVIMDCCHSGSNTRAIGPPDEPVKERFLPSPWDIAAEESGRSIPKKVGAQLRRSKRSARSTTDIVNADIPEVLITGCRDTQTSADAFIDGRYNGALTYGLVQAIRQAKGDLTYRELHQRASAVLKKKKFEQVPQLESRKAQFDWPLFSV